VTHFSLGRVALKFRFEHYQQFQRTSPRAVSLDFNSRFQGKQVHQPLNNFMVNAACPCRSASVILR
jgi:hypothetical protein